MSHSQTKRTNDFSQEEFSLKQKPLNLKSIKKANILLEPYKSPISKNAGFKKLIGLPSIQTTKGKHYQTRTSSRYFSHAFFKQKSVTSNGKNPLELKDRASRRAAKSTIVKSYAEMMFGGSKGSLGLGSSEKNGVRSFRKQKRLRKGEFLF